MKKIILLVIILVINTLLIVSKESEKELIVKIALENLQNLRDSNWEYVKDRLFDGESENVSKISGPILIKLEGATKIDSSAVKRVKDELELLLPHKTIDYFDNFVGRVKGNTKLKKKDYYGIPLPKLYPSVLNLNFKKLDPYNKDDVLNTTILLDGSIIERSPRFRDYKRIRMNPESVFFSFKSSLSLENRKNYIQYELFRWLCFLNPEKTYKISGKGIFASPDFTPENAKLNDLDKFLLQKLYADDFLDQFKDYLYKNYPWRYAAAFLNKKLAKLYAVSIIGLTGLLVFVLIFGLFKNRTFKYSFLNYLLPVLCIWVFYSNLKFLYGYLTDFHTLITWDDILIYGLIIVSIIALISSFVLWVLEYFFINVNIKFSFKLILKTVFTFLAFSVPITAIFLFDGHMDEGIDFFFPSFLFFVALALARGLFIYLNYFSESLIKEKEVELSKLKELHAQAETKLLQSQINPHFLYNALNSIASLAPVDSKKTQKMAYSLSDLFKYSINRKGKKVSTVKDEIEMVKSYLDIEKIRFGDRLQFVIEVGEGLENNKIPLFLIQPLVENAVKHGISQVEGSGKIVLKIEKEAGHIIIRVGDSGPDFPEGLVSGHGLQTVYDLLRLSYGENAVLNWTNTPEKMITITIPDTL